MSGWGDAREILAVRLDSLGDVLMCTPAIRALANGARPKPVRAELVEALANPVRAELVEASSSFRDTEKEQCFDRLNTNGGGGIECASRRVTLLTSPAGAAIARLAPEIADVIVWSAPWMKATAQADPQVDRALIDRLAERGFDAAVILTCYSQNPLPAALICHLAGIPLRAAHCRDKPYALLTDSIAEPEPHEGIRHEVRRQLDLVAALGFAADDERMSLAVPRAARVDASAWLAGRGLLDRPWAMLHPGASAESRRWPPEFFAAAARALIAEHGWRIVLAGGGPERAPVDAIAAEVPEAIRAPERDLAGFAALLEQAPLLIANNSGPMHMAAAIGVPVVCLYALTNPQHTPWMTPSVVLNHDVPCRWCERSICPERQHHCLRLVEPRQVVEAALSLARVPA